MRTERWATNVEVFRCICTYPDIVIQTGDVPSKTLSSVTLLQKLIPILLLQTSQITGPARLEKILPAPLPVRIQANVRKQIVRVGKEIVVEPHTATASIRISASAPRNGSGDLALHGCPWGQFEVAGEVGYCPEGLTFGCAEAVADGNMAEESDGRVILGGDHLVESEGGHGCVGRCVGWWVFEAGELL